MAMGCFEQSSDFPLATTPFTTAEEEALDPPPFLPPVFDSCDRVAIVDKIENNVIWTRKMGDGGSLAQIMKEDDRGDDGDSNGSSPDSEDDVDDDDESDKDSDDEELQDVVLIKQGGEEAYWLQRSLRDAIYGRIRYGLVAKRRTSQAELSLDYKNMDGWDVSNQRCAVKEIVRERVQRKRRSCKEDPFKEVSALQHMLRWERKSMGKKSRDKALTGSHIVTPFDVLSDANFLYIVMPYCDGGGLSDCLADKGRFDEEQARYWMHQIMKVLDSLQKTCVCHRDISLDNLMIHENECQIIDMGLCLRIPYAMVGENKKRALLKPQGCCGKPYFVAPEIWRSRKPFDGFAVDMWAAGVILFFLLAGFPPWERPDDTDLQFMHLTNGNLGYICNHRWNLGLSPAAVDLLQRMLQRKPSKRLSLDQVLAHPWMLNVSLDLPELTAKDTTPQSEAHNPLPFPPAISDPCLRVPVIGNTAKIIWTRPIDMQFNDEQDESSSESDSDDDSEDESVTKMGVLLLKQGSEEAYWLQNSLRETVYGRVMYGLIVKRHNLAARVSQSLDAILKWETTDKRCVVKEIPWVRIHKLRKLLMKDPIQEVASLQYLRSWNKQISQNNISCNTISDTHVVVPLDLLSDGYYLYSVTPFCDGGKLFSRLEDKGVFDEGEARYWIHQILEGLETLQRAGICHRCIGLENLMIHNDCCVIIDMGMSLRVPYCDEGEEKVQRFLMTPQGRGSKIIYMPPEIWRNSAPFDGYSVDMWAVGVILFIMLAGFPPWHIPSVTDERFKIITSGGLENMCATWGLEISADVMDLLQGMFWHDPLQRFSLEQVRLHPWMLHRDNG